MCEANRAWKMLDFFLASGGPWSILGESFLPRPDRLEPFDEKISWVYTRRIARCHRHHCRAGRHVAADAEQDAGVSQPNSLPQQSPAAWHRLPAVRALIQGR